MDNNGDTPLDFGDFLTAEAELKTQIALTPERNQIWHDLAVLYALQEKSDELIKTITDAEKILGSSIDFIINIFLDLISRPSGYTVSEKLSKNLPIGHRAQIIAIYFSGCSLINENRTNSAFKNFDLFRNYVIKNKNDFPMENSCNMNIIFRQALLIEKPEIVAEIASQNDQSFPDYFPNLSFDTKPNLPKNSNTPVIVSCCNGLYFEKFGDLYIDSVIQHNPRSILHVHIAETNTSINNKILSVRKKHPNFMLNYSTEKNSQFTGNVYFSCIRFLLAERFLNLYKTKILISDIDGKFKANFRKLLLLTNGADFSCFSSKRLEPASIYQAGLTCFSYTTSAINFSRVLRKLILLKLKLPAGLGWMLDQAAIFSAIHFMLKQPNFKFNNISIQNNLVMADFFESYDNPAEKLRLMLLSSQ